ARACTGPAANRIGTPATGEVKAHANSFAPRAASRRRAYGAPIQGPIVHRRRSATHRRHPVPAPPAR
ncbi:MAG: hypothetical protein ACHQD6_01700, partial [Steroidobacterales bacterium]